MKTHDNLVQAQFGAQARSYVESAVHASGADLDWIAARAGELNPRLALDLGAGGGHVSYRIAAHCAEVIACDLSSQMLEAVSGEAAARGIGNIRCVSAAAEALPFADHTFELVVTRFSAHHWREVEQGLGEVRRVLAPGCPAIIVDAAAPEFRAADTHLQAVELLRDSSHVRNYSRSEWLRMLADAGFAVSSVSSERLRMDFATWTARMNVPPSRAGAIREIQALASSEVSNHFAIEPDGSFMLPTLAIEAD